MVDVEGLISAGIEFLIETEEGGGRNVAGVKSGMNPGEAGDTVPVVEVTIK